MDLDCQPYDLLQDITASIIAAGRFAIFARFVNFVLNPTVPPAPPLPRESAGLVNEIVSRASDLVGGMSL